MDYGQSNQNGSEQPFFTAGVGLGTERNDVVNEKDANLSKDSASWVTENPQKVGNKVIDINERRLDPIQVDAGQKEPKLGEIVNLEFPPDSQNSEEKKTDDNLAAESINNSSNIINLADFRADKKDKISSKTLQNMNHVVDEFKKGNKSPADLDNFVWDAKKAYLKGSYGRDIAA